jgi:hypothetical protein
MWVIILVWCAWHNGALLPLLLLLLPPAGPPAGSSEWEAGDEEGPPPPELVPGWVDMMRRCWAEAPDDRPAFSTLVQQLQVRVAYLACNRQEAAFTAAPQGATCICFYAYLLGC